MSVQKDMNEIGVQREEVKDRRTRRMKTGCADLKYGKRPKR